MKQGNMTVSFAPHIQDSAAANRIMLDVIIALSPVIILSIYDFDIPFFEYFQFLPEPALLIGICVASCVFFEWAFQKLVKRKNTVKDLSAVVTGLLLALCLPEEIHPVLAVFGSFVAIVFVKQLFGGIGKNFANPAVTARVVLLVAFPAAMATTWYMPFSGELDLELLIGRQSNFLGDGHGLALVAGGVYLLIRRVITWHIPVTFIGTVFVVAAITGNDPVFQVFSGSLLLGAIFMATDYTTSPLTAKRRIIFGVMAGLHLVLFRYGNYQMAVSYTILLMNMATPLINKFAAYRALGEKR
ncbi:MAG: RnfABCDGE type electron transport complex subunit D [Treponema sp.]|nr:RnfABCDGE type electron transport complex subunit D [Treponema sp.]